MRPKVYKLQNLGILGRRRAPGGFRMVKKCFPEKTSSYFMLYLLKTRNIITVKYSQNYFEITFGWTNFLPKNSKLKLVFNEAEKEPRKESFPWDLGLILVQPIWSTWIFEYKFLYSKETTMHSTSFILLSQPWKMTIFPKTRSRMLVNFLLGMRSSLWDLKKQ